MRSHLLGNQNRKLRPDVILLRHHISCGVGADGEFAQGQGLTQEPLAQLWVFWVTAILAAAIVALVIIVSQLLGTPKTSVDSDVAEAAMAQAGEVPAEDEAEAVQIAEAENYNVPLTGEQTDNDYSVIEEEDAEEETEQDDSQTDSADGVERH